MALTTKNKESQPYTKEELENENFIDRNRLLATIDIDVNSHDNTKINEKTNNN